MRRAEQEYEIKITGKPALALIAVLVVIFGWRLAVTHDTVPPEVAERLREVLAAEYAGKLLSDIQKALDERDAAKANDNAALLIAYTQEITFTSLKSRGGGDHYVVRAEINVDGGPPPSGKQLRYFKFSKSVLLGYVYDREATAFEYYFPFMD